MAALDQLLDRSWEAIVVVPSAIMAPSLAPSSGDLVAIIRELAAHGVEVLIWDLDTSLGTTLDALADWRASGQIEPLLEKPTTALQLEALFKLCARKGIGAGLVLIIFSAVGTASEPGRDHDIFLAAPQRAGKASVGDEPAGLEDAVVHLGGGAARTRSLLRAQLERRRNHRVPAVDFDPAWTLALDPDSPGSPRVHEALLTLCDGRFGTRGSLEEGGQASRPLVLAAGIYGASKDGGEALLACPNWTVGIELGGISPGRRILDMRTGVLLREAPSGQGSGPQMRSLRFSCLERPGTAAMRVEAPRLSLQAISPLQPPSPAQGEIEYSETRDHRIVMGVSSASRPGGVGAAATQLLAEADGLETIERLASYVADPTCVPTAEEALEALGSAQALGFDRLLAEQRRVWAERWQDAEISIEGDAEAELATRFCLFQLLSVVADQGECGLGARGLSGPAYSGHVFWDADVFVLPVMAAVHPGSARAMLEYRIRRLPAAREAAAKLGLDGARFPWESAADGSDVTPRSATAPDGSRVDILTGELEEHIVADVAWAAWQYAAWSGDQSFLKREGAPLVFETARYWASRVEVDPDGSGHIRKVIGPDEYHIGVDDNAFTNLMARWNLHLGAQLLDASEKGGQAGSRLASESDELASRWRKIADCIVDGYDPATGLYEQFKGFFDLEPLVISEIASVPVAADVLLGASRVAGSQVIKQADVLMAHHLIPDGVESGSLGPNLDFYGPRSAQGSSLSPGIQASLLARAGRVEEALDVFHLACRIDLDDVGDTTAGGLHLAAMGGAYQALVFGFAGVRAIDEGLVIDPNLPRSWGRLGIRLRFRHSRIALSLGHGEIAIQTDRPFQVVLGGKPRPVASSHSRFVLKGERWQEDI